MTDEHLQKTSSMGQYREYAELLNTIEQAKHDLLVAMAGDVPKTVYRDGYDKISDGESRLRSDLENRMAKEHPDDFNLEVFYGND